MSALLYRLGRAAFRRRGTVLIAWLLILAGVGAGGALLSQGFDNKFSIPGTESQEALDSLSSTFPQVSGASATVIVVAPEGGDVTDTSTTKAIESFVTDVEKLDQVAAVTSPFDELVKGAVNDTNTAALISVQMDVSQAEVTAQTKTELEDAGEALKAEAPEGTVVSVGGEVFANNVPGLTITEAVGVIIALLVMYVTFRALLAAIMPLVTALIGVGISTCLILLATLLGPVSSTTPLLAVMIGLAVGIDYALFILSRHRDQLAEGLDPEESTARATATAGSAVLFAGLTVMIALVGLSVAQIPFLTTMGIAAAVAVAVAVLIALTLTPALLGFAGERMRPKVRAPRKRKGGDGEAERVAKPAASLRWVRAVTKRPVVTIVSVVVLLGIASIPALSLRLALPDNGTQAAGSPARVTYDLVAEEFSPGHNAPLLVTANIINTTDPVGVMNDIAAKIEALPGVDSVPLATPNEAADTGIVQVIPEGDAESQETQDLVADIRGLQDEIQQDYGVAIQVTGFTAVGIDVSALLGEALLPFALVVVGLSLILLTMVFRSIAVPIKATIGFLLSATTAFGVTAMVFEWGWGAEALHVARTGSVISFLPIILMGVLFGLAMDYEVFLVSRIREAYVHGASAREAIEKGFTASARVVIAAAIIMIAVFAAFVPEGDPTIKPIALSLAVGVFVDAFIVRMTLVPAVLALLGDRAWWIPRWLDTRLPSFDVEGEALHRELELAEWPSAGSTAVIAAENLGLTGPRGPVFHDVSVSVQPSRVLVIHGPRGTGKSSLLLALTGRLAPDTGRLKVTGLVLPERAMSMRSSAAVVRFMADENPEQQLADALRRRPRILAIDDLDAIIALDRLEELWRTVDNARRTAIVEGRELTVLVTTQSRLSIPAFLLDEDASFLELHPANAPEAASEEVHA